MPRFLRISGQHHRWAPIVPLGLLLIACATGCGDDSEPAAEAARSSAPVLVPLDESGELSASGEVELFASTAAMTELPPEMRIFAIQQLGVLGTEDTVAPIANAMRDRDPKIVLAAVQALPDTKNAAALDGLRAAAEHDDPKVSAAAEARLRQLD